MPARSPRRLAALVASDIGTRDRRRSLARPRSSTCTNSSRNVFQPFVVVMRDGRSVSNHDDVPGGAARSDRACETRAPGRVRSAPSCGRPGRADRGRGPRPRWTSADALPWEAAPILIDGEPVGRVAVLGSDSARCSASLRELGPTMAPGRRRRARRRHDADRLHSCSARPTAASLKPCRTRPSASAAAILGARAPKQGGDEVAAVARSFNRMADELTAAPRRWRPPTGAPATARRRLTRADDAADRDARLRRDADDDGARLDDETRQRYLAHHRR